MLCLATVLSLTLAADIPKAAAAYTEAMGYYQKGQWEKAVDAFDAALKESANENPNLSYRAQGVTVRVEYYPYYYSGMSKYQLALQASGPEEKKRRLIDAVNQLKVSVHPDNKGATAKARSLLDEVEARLKAPPPTPVPLPPDPFPAALARVKGEVDGLGKAERFEEALESVRTSAGFSGHETERKELLENIRSRQASAVKDRDARLALQMEQLASRNPLEDPAARFRSLEEARIPPAVQRDVAPKFRWLDDFLAACEKSRESLEKAPRLDERAVCDAAQVFEQLAKQALDAEFLPGFRAARNVAHSLRLARLNALPSAGLGVKETWSRSLLLDAAEEESRKNCEELLRPRLEKTSDPVVKEEMRKYLAETAVAYRQGAATALGRLARPETEEQIDQAVAGLKTTAVIVDPDKLRGISSGLAALQSDAGFLKLKAADQARAIFVAAVAQVEAGFLEGEPREKIVERCAPFASKAYKLDANVSAPWRDQLSPKVLSLLEELGKR
jgi:hypothetical protein